MPDEIVITRECRSCSFFVGNAGGGGCHRYPPTPLVTPTQNPLQRSQGLEVKGWYNPVGPKDWCGEYARNPSYVPPTMGGRQ